MNPNFSVSTQTDDTSGKLTAEQIDILYGTLLGDASLKTQTKGNTYAYHIEQTIEASATTPDKRSYIEHIYDKFRPFVNPDTPPAILTAELGCKLGFTTKVNKCFLYYGKQFYRPTTEEEKLLHKQTGAKKESLYKKVVPLDIHEHLNDRVLAYWYMDDGALKGKNREGKTLSTHGFTEEEVCRLSAALKSLGIKANVTPESRAKTQKTYYKLFITAPSDAEFTVRIRPYVLPVFDYKMNPYRDNPTKQGVKSKERYRIAEQAYKDRQAKT